MSPRLEVEHDKHDEAQDERRSRGQGVRAALLALAVAGLVGGSWLSAAPSTTRGHCVSKRISAISSRSASSASSAFASEAGASSWLVNISCAWRITEQARACAYCT